ncbi:succinic semialdehyde dehydrogenase [Mycobacterium sp. C31M]
MTTTTTPVNLPANLSHATLAALAGTVTAAPHASTVTTYAPYTGEPIGQLPQSSTGDVAAAFIRARQAQFAWSQTPIEQRERILLRFHDLLLGRQAAVLDLIQLENGKTRKDAFFEVIDIATTSRYYARTARKLLAPKRRRGAVPLLTRTSELRHPKGVVAIVSPWNYPLSMAAGDAIPALMAGNAVVQKPDTQTAFTALWALDLMREAGLPEDVWQIVVGRGSVIGDTLMDNADYVMFTGSTAAGRRIAREAGERLIGSSLELGGKNALLVLDDAEIDRAAEGAVNACFPSAGQLCVSVERLYVHDSIYDKFVADFVRRTENLDISSAFDFSGDVGSLTNASQLDAVTAHVADAVGKGATVLAGGTPRPDIGPLFYEPTILTDVTPEMAVFEDESFGPVVSVYRYTDLDDAIALTNSTSYGLNASVWTRDGARGRAVAARIHAGTVNVNEAFAAAWGSVDAPMGGMGDSGLGRRHGAEGLLKYTEAQTVAQQRLYPIKPRAGVPFGWWRSAVTLGLKAAKNLGMA